MIKVISGADFKPTMIRPWIYVNNLSLEEIHIKNEKYPKQFTGTAISACSFDKGVDEFILRNADAAVFGFDSSSTKADFFLFGVATSHLPTFFLFVDSTEQKNWEWVHGRFDAYEIESSKSILDFFRKGEK